MSTKALKLLLGTMLVTLLALIGFGALVMQDKGFPWDQPTQSASPSPSPSTTEKYVAAMKVPVPADSNCKECHKAAAVDVVNVPMMGHQLSGWENCTACHGHSKLVETAPGHRGIHRASCLMCHQERPITAPAALPRKHHTFEGKDCTDCHRVGGPGPLPETMMSRKNCWVCHIDSANQDLFKETENS